MSNAFINMVRTQASLVQNSVNLTQLGSVIAYDPITYTVQVLLYPQDGDVPALQTGWIPLFTPWTGSGWGLFAPPNIGDIVEVHYQDGSLQNAYAGLRAFINGAPLPVNSGEWWLVHKSGSFIKVTNDQKISINGELEVDVSAPTVNITSSGTINVEAPAVNLGLGPTFTELLNGVAAGIFNNHIHIDSTNHDTSIPTTQMGASSLTSNTKAS